MAIALAVGMTVVFWWPFWLGGGPQGGDLYSYYMPQKVVLAEALQRGEIPLWNDRTGFGYPAAAESQTGVLYPPNLVLYRLFAPNSAYVWSQLIHYVIAFLATWGLIRQLGFSTGAAALGSLAFVYGWLPPRICLEWAVVGAAYFSVILWCMVGWLQTGCPRSLGAMAIALGLDLLAGHFNLAFITVLAIGVFALINFCNAKQCLGAVAQTGESRRRSYWLIAAIAGGFLVAAVQVLPTWELKQASQRKAVGAAFDPGYGHMPPIYVTQLIAPWMWHGPEFSTDRALEQPTPGRYPTATNMVEAHLYVGLIPLLLAFWTLGLRWRGALSFPVAPWLLLSVAGIVLATGWPLMVLKYLPGFSFFMGPGRYGMLTAMSLAVLGAAGWDAFAHLFKSPVSRRWGIVLAFAITTMDLWCLSREYTFKAGPGFGRQVFYTTLLDDVPVNHVHESEAVARLLRDHPAPRLYAPGANMPSLMGISCLPVYLGLGPQIYFEPEQQIDFSIQDPGEIAVVSQRLRDWGVTHLFLQQRLSSPDWPVDYVADVMDPVVNRAMGRPEPFYLYALQNAPGRAMLTSDGKITSFRSHPNQVVIDYSSSTDADLLLADLAFPGWTASIDGVAVQNSKSTPFREISVPAGEHQVVWSYRPRTVLLGLCLSLASLAHILFFTWRAYRARLMCTLPSAKPK